MRSIYAKTLFLAITTVIVPLNSATAQQGVMLNDKDIHVVHYEKLEYPPAAASDKIEGVVVVKLRLDDDGRVLDAAALSGAPMLSLLAVPNARKWQFSPNPQKAAIIVYNFRIGAGCRRKSPYSQMTFNPPNFVTIVNCKAPVWVP